jgi:hypothetical protein
MAGKYPDIVVYISDTEGNMDFSNRNRQVALWPAKDGKVDRNGNPYWTGSIGSDPKDSKRFVLAYTYVPKEQSQSEDRPVPTDQDVPF